MPPRFFVGLIVLLLCATCGPKPTNFDWRHYEPPDWHKYQAQSVESDFIVHASASALRPLVSDRVTFSNLKNESDQSLAQRLLGAVGQRITYIDRHKERWRYYRNNNNAAESIDMYTHPNPLGSQYGLCGVERYTITFDDFGRIYTVAVTNRYGVEGAIFQKTNFDWNHYNNVMCKSVSASHAPSYFPASDDLIARDMAMLFISAIYLAQRVKPLPYRISCHKLKRPCGDDIRTYLSGLRLKDIDGFDLSNCPLPGGPKVVCFTIRTGEGRLG